jgi:hypothetical protein
MFEIGDVVEVVVESDVLYGTQGVVVEVYESVSKWRNYGLLINDPEGFGCPVLWFSWDEIKKV